MNIGNKIKELRVKNKITQEELAKALQVSTQAVSKWENGGSPDLELIPTIANYFHVSTDYLFDLKQDQIADIEQKLWMYLQSFDMKERMNVVYKLGFYMSVASRNEKMDMLENLKNFFKTEMSNENYYSNIICEEGIIITSLAQDNKIFMCLPKNNQSNYSKILKSDQKQRLFCQYLSDELFYRALIFLYSQNEKNFTESYLKDYLNISIEQAREILLQMEEFKIVQCSQVPIDDSYLNLYTVLPNPQIVGLIALLDMVVNKPNTYYYYFGGPTNYFKE